MYEIKLLKNVCLEMCKYKCYTCLTRLVVPGIASVSCFNFNFS